MPRRRTQKPIKIILENERRSQLDDLIESWSMMQKKFMLQSIREYSPSPILPTKGKKEKVKEFFLGRSEGENQEAEDLFTYLMDDEIFSNPNLRYKITGERNPKKAFHKIFDKEITGEDRKYLLHRLKQETDDVFVPQEILNEFRIGARRHLNNILLEDELAPKAPFYLVIGPTGSGKTKTITTAIERALFNQELIVEPKVHDELEAILEEHPIMARLDLPTVAPEVAQKIEEEKRRKKLERRAKIPIIKHFYKEETAELLEEEEREFGLEVDVDQIHPNNVQTMWYGETGNKMMKSFGHKGITSIRILEEAHALLRVHQSLGAGVQEDTLVATFNIILDEVEKGERDCMVVALTRKGEEFHEDIYRRFMEKGRIIDMSDYWKRTETIDELVQIEVAQQDIAMPDALERYAISEKVLEIFEYRKLDVTPAYVRKLIASIAEEKGELKEEYFEDGALVRNAFVNVARNLYPEMFRKTYNRLTRDVEWDDYVGDVKEEFQRLVNQCLRYDLAAEKGAVLAGPPGTGKTYLARTYLSRHKDISAVILKMEDLHDERNPIDGPVKKLAQAFDIAKMCAPSMLFVDEGDAVAMERQGNINDRITNKLLNAIDGEVELNGVFVVLTTNKPEHLAEAATRSGRLKVMPITGKLREKDVYRMLENHINQEELAAELSKERIYATAKRVCATPADYSKFFETLIGFRNEEYKVMDAAIRIKKSKMKFFVEANYKVLMSIAKSLDFSKEFLDEAMQDPAAFVVHQEAIRTKFTQVISQEAYPLTLAHLERTKQDRIQTPRVKGKITLDDYLQDQLSSEPQVGFVIGAGASETTGTIVPISSSLVYDLNHRGEKTVVTGAVRLDTPQAAQVNAAIEMTKQSAREALTLVLNYLDSLAPQKDMKKIIGTYLQDSYFHHQFLTANYQLGGPSAGMALALNTLSVILNLPLREDFGITGAPWSRGKTKEDVGSAVIVGGVHNKAQIVLNYLERIYVPEQNVKDVDLLTLESYWQKGKDVIGYASFSDIVSEAFCFNQEIDLLTQDLFALRIQAKQQDLISPQEAKELYTQVEQKHTQVRALAEEVICKRTECIEKYLRDPQKEEFVSLPKIFEKYA